MPPFRRQRPLGARHALTGQDFDEWMHDVRYWLLKAGWFVPEQFVPSQWQRWQAGYLAGRPAKAVAEEAAQAEREQRATR